jgi:hypothetical protein
MRESVVSEKADQRLREFETIGNIQPSQGWDEALMKRIESAKPGSAISLSFSGLVIPIILVVLLNIGFILNFAIKNSQQTSFKNQEFTVISEELLINPVSIKN